MHQQISRDLLQDLLVATAENDEASQKFKAVMEQMPSGLPHPDGTEMIRNVSSKLSIARKKMMTAHRRLDEFLNRGIEPDDLKRSG